MNEPIIPANKATLFRLLQSKGVGSEYRTKMLNRFANAKTESERWDIIHEVQNDTHGGGRKYQHKA